MSFIFVGYNNFQQSKLDDLKTDISLLKNLSDENKILNDKVEILETQTKEFKDEISILKESITINTYPMDLTDLSTYESLKFEEFRLNYDDNVLIGLEPVSICKMYLYTTLIGDYETQYELYTTNEEGFFIPKEEYMKISREYKLPSYKPLEVYKLNIKFDGPNEEYATITWYSNGPIDERPEAFHGFHLRKDKEIWKVSFVPMQ